MSGFSTQTDPQKPAKKLEFATDKEAAVRLKVKSERTIRRYKHDPRAREILGVVPYGKQCRIPKQQNWAKIARQLENLGKTRHVPRSRIFKREMGWGNPRRERDTKILRLALKLQRLMRKQRLTEKLKWQLEQVWKMAQIIAAKHSCTVFNAPKFVRKFLEAANEKERKRNAPQIEWLKHHGLWDEAKTLIKKGDYSECCENGETRRFYFRKGEAHFDVVETFERKGKNVSIPHRISIYPVETKAQLSRAVRQFNKVWPSPKAIKKAKLDYNETWWKLDIERAAAELRRKKKRITPETLRKVLYRDETAQLEKHPGISRSTYFRRYDKDDLARVCRVRAGNELRLPNKKHGGVRDVEEVGIDDLRKMSISDASGWQFNNPYRDSDEED